MSDQHTYPKGIYQFHGTYVSNAHAILHFSVDRLQNFHNIRPATIASACDLSERIGSQPLACKLLSKIGENFIMFGKQQLPTSLQQHVKSLIKTQVSRTLALGLFVIS